MLKIIQIISLFICIFAFIGLLVYTDAYDDVQRNVVELLCFSCLKLDPILDASFTFETANNDNHPDFVTDNLSTGIVFLHYSKDACAGCDVMLPTIQDLFSVSYGKQEMFQKQLIFNQHIIHYYYINIDHTIPEKENSFSIYDKNHREGLPMFTIVTLHYDRGTIKPYYTSLYGTLGKNYDTHQKRYDYLTSLINDSIDLWEEHSIGYEQPN